MNKKALLFINGKAPQTFPKLSEYKTIFCTDGAYAYLQLAQISPDFVVGDMDSIALNSVSKETEIVHSSDQNSTDFEKALQLLLEKEFNAVDVYGASGDEQDHFLGNLSAAYRLKNQMEICFYDEFSRFFFIESPWTINQVKNRMISLFPFPECKKVITKGLQYPLNNEDLNLTNRVGTRNHAIEDTISVEFKEGALLVFVSRDVRDK